MNLLTVSLLVIILIYLGITLGILIRFIEEERYSLLRFSLIIPFLVIIINIRYLISKTFKSKKILKNKMRLFRKILYMEIRYYNLLIELNIQIFMKTYKDVKLEKNYDKIKSFKKNIFSEVYVNNEQFLAKRINAY
ncbi:hypothetical protein GKZ28_14605 [Clostridium chromiireducens]|uniref:Uncharacterized protein n=1 Tax=Clostridium chromiireducens TaxID=225345 RepID=A0A964RNP2_9CLOT|nr:hypothetical protein [Clostridium chromiireducens]MVX64923.1 hypothetical protein [Clostridium chromiireducens]